MATSKQVRTTISLPAASLTAARGIAKARRVHLSTVVAEALEASLKQLHSKAHSRVAFTRYQRAFAGFTDQELLILDGIIPGHRG